MNISPIIKYRTLAIAKGMAPVDTGNLRHNAISLKRVKSNSWAINYSTQRATYLEPLEEGWSNPKTGEVYQPHKGFISKTSLVVGNYVYQVLMGEKPQYSSYLKKALSTAQNTELREQALIKSKMRYSEYKKIQKDFANQTTSFRV